MDVVKTTTTMICPLTETGAETEILSRFPLFTVDLNEANFIIYHIDNTLCMLCLCEPCHVVSNSHDFDESHEIQSAAFSVCV